MLRAWFYNKLLNYILYIIQKSYYNRYANFVSFNVFMDVLGKICWYSDNALNSFITMGSVYKKTSNFPRLLRVLCPCSHIVVPPKSYIIV